MVYVDNRQGSKGLYPLISAKGVPCTLTRLDYGDVYWLGSGPNGVPVSVGIEVKTVQDVVNSIATGRFAGHQLPGLVQSYEQVYLLIEGAWRPNLKTGILESRHVHGHKYRWLPVSAGTRQFMYRDLVTWLCTMQVKGGIQITRSLDWNEATIWLCTLYQWWTSDKGYDGHKSHLAFYDGTRHGAPYKRYRATRMVAGLPDRALLVKPSLVRMVAAQLPSIGWEKSKVIAQRYRTVEELCAATPEELVELEGIGPTLAKGVFDSLRSSK